MQTVKVFGQRKGKKEIDTDFKVQICMIYNIEKFFIETTLLANNAMSR